MRSTIDGPGADLLTIDAQQQSRIFDITATTGDYTIDGLTLTGGKPTGFEGGPAAFNGGAIRSLTTGLLTLDHVGVIGNSTTTSIHDGGGVFASGDLALNQCTVTGNTSTGNGGGVYSGGNVTVTASTIRDNHGTSGKGGGIFAKGTLTVTDGTISDNSARDSGGGLSAQGKVTVDHSTVSGNTSTRGSGGGVYSRIGQVAVIG